ncbi:MAG: ribosomal methyltransferase RsmE [Betaproteobacteria bacterium]|nr:ribosomal methyltransferase RsmE [Betaproteobacteria bacterium]
MRRAVPNDTRIYAPDAHAQGAIVALPETAAHHLARVLRAAVGDRVIVFNDGIEYGAVITGIDKHGVSVKLEAGSPVDRENPLTCVLAQAISSGERMDLTLQKAAELGVRSVQPLYSERSIVRLDAERAIKRAEHWRQVMISACEQCGRNRVPDVAAPQPVIEWLGALPPPRDGELRALMAPRADAGLASLAPPASVLLMAGPEGGFTEAESTFAHERGFVALKLGPRILRTETAALAALAAFNARWGDF